MRSFRIYRGPKNRTQGRSLLWLGEMIWAFRPYLIYAPKLIFWKDISGLRLLCNFYDYMCNLKLITAVLKIRRRAAACYG
jgi:hypothetical protein